MNRKMKPNTLRKLLTDEAQRRSSDPQADWSAIIGPLHIYPSSPRAGANWSVIPGGTPVQAAIAREAAATIATAHPQVAFHLRG